MGLEEIWGDTAGKLLVVGLTGGIASGKTEVAEELARLGAKVIDADIVAREVVLPGAPVYTALVEAFGEDIIDETGEIDRSALAEKVFCDEERLRKLNSITHPGIFAEIARQVSEFARERKPGTVPAVVIDAALIVDVGAAAVFDLLLVVTASEETRVRRLIENRCASPAEARDRMTSQVPERNRVEMADILIENDGTLEELRAQVARAWDEISRRASQVRE